MNNTDKKNTTVDMLDIIKIYELIFVSSSPI